jgi:hypothetical protein
MNWFLEECVKQGFKDIVALGSDSHEEAGGYQTEYDTVTAVARTSTNGCRKIKMTRTSSFAPNGRTRVSSHATDISEAEYVEQSAMGSPVNPSALLMAQLAKATKANKAARKRPPR